VKRKDESRAKGAPPAESWYDTGSEKWAFTTYERDAESGNDYAMARYNVSRLGRFSSPDPLAGSIRNPQSLNRFAYGGNDPLNLVDPTGLSTCNPDDYTLQNPMPAICTEATEEDSGSSCTLDGITADCGVMGFGGGDFVQCPNNICQGFGRDSQGNSVYAYFTAGAGGSSGYYAGNYQGFNEINGMFLSDGDFQHYLKNIDLAAIADQFNAAVAALIKNGASTEQIEAFEAANAGFDGVVVEDGNANFINPEGKNGQLMFGSGCPHQRCDLDGLGTLGFSHGTGAMFHLDTADPFNVPFGTLAHGLVDYIGGKFFMSVIPRH